MAQRSTEIDGGHSAATITSQAGYILDHKPIISTQVSSGQLVVSNIAAEAMNIGGRGATTGKAE